jgi:ferredoxin-NADP reductase
LCATPIGTRLRVGAAKGLFRLAPGDQRDHLLFATGTGVAPLLSMTAALLAKPGPPRVVIVHGVRHTPELAFRRRLEGWAKDFPHVTYVAAVSRPDGALPAGIQSGRALDLLPAACKQLELSAGSLVAYLCGNPNVVTAGAHWLVEQGVDPAAVKREEYWPVTADVSRAERAAQ